VSILIDTFLSFLVAKLQQQPADKGRLNIPESKLTNNFRFEFLHLIDLLSFVCLNGSVEFVAMDFKLPKISSVA
jgi:hypothetical protein